MIIVQAAKLVGAGVATAGLTGAGVGLGTVFGALIVGVRKCNNLPIINEMESSSEDEALVPDVDNQAIINNIIDAEAAGNIDLGLVLYENNSLQSAYHYMLTNVQASLESPLIMEGSRLPLLQPGMTLNNVLPVEEVQPFYEEPFISLWERFQNNLRPILEGPNNFTHLNINGESFTITIGDLNQMNSISMAEIQNFDFINVVNTVPAAVIDTFGMGILFGTSAILLSKHSNPELLSDTINNVYNTVKYTLGEFEFGYYETVPEYSHHGLVTVFNKSQYGFLNLRKLCIRLHDYIPIKAEEVEIIGPAFRGEYIHYNSLVNELYKIEYIDFRALLAHDLGYLSNAPHFFLYSFELSQGSVDQIQVALNLLAATGYV